MFRSTKLYWMSGFNPDAMDEVFAALTCGAPDKERSASDAGEKKKKTKDKEKGRRKRQKTKDKNAALKYSERNEEKAMKKATGFLVLFFCPCFTREEMGKICR